MRRRLRLPALLLAVLPNAVATPAFAQFYDAAQQVLDLSLDPIARSPRLLGLGRMAWVGDDPQNRITLWDFAGNPVGIVTGDTTSTVQVRPGGATESSVHDLPGIERQDLAARETHVNYEMWRHAGTAAYGMAGNLGSLRFDRPYNATTERRSQLLQPTVMPVVAGRLPFTDSGRWLCAARLLFSGESQDDEYRLFTTAGGGQFLDQDGYSVDPPDEFTPTSFKVRTFGGGASVAWRPGPWLTAAIGGDAIHHRITGSNSDPRHESATTESRPYKTGQASLVGRVGSHLEWGVDGRGWTSHSEERWRFTVSAGIGVDPLNGRGKLLEREDRGNAVRTRVRWTYGPWEAGAGFNTLYRRVNIIPPAAYDVTSFNHFMDELQHVSGADSLRLVDSVTAGELQERAFETGAGLAWHMPGRRGLLAAEYHTSQDQFDQTIAGHGPEAKTWDVRTGAEYQLTRALAARGGYRYRVHDADALIAQNTFVSHTMSLGTGVQPEGAHWIMDAGYSVEWFQADFGDPGRPHGSRQQLSAQLRWEF
jgi:hypothetical protein